MNQHPRVLKSGSVAELLAAGQFNYEDLKQRCEVYLDSVRKQSREMLLEAQQQIEKDRQQAMEAGRQAGLAKGLQQAEEQLQQRVKKQAEQLTQQKLQKILPPLQQAVEQLQQAQQHCLSRWETQSLELILLITEKLVHQKLALEPDLVCQRVAEVLKLTVGTTQIQLQLSSADIEAVGPQLELVVNSLRQKADIQLVPDARLQPGDCVVQTEHGQIDARLETQLQRIAEELLG